MKTFITTLVLVGALSLFTFAKAPMGTQVPNKVQFLDITLQLDGYAQRRVQEKVSSLHRSAAHYQLFLDRCNLYFPVIDAILKKEGVPLDFKYAALQESTLKGNAVSKTGATGYWQFKDFTAKEMGLIVNNRIDERSHVISSTTAAARYMKKNYAMLGNWFTTLIAHNIGAGDVKRKIGEQYNGKRIIKLNRSTHPYVFFVLANKIAFEDALGKHDAKKIKVFNAKAGTKLTDIAEKTAISLHTLQEHNHWLKRNTLPNDKASYYVVIPMSAQDERRIASTFNTNRKNSTEGTFVSVAYESSAAETFSEPLFSAGNTDRIKPVITKGKKVTIDNYSLNMVSANGLPAFVAETGQSPATVASFLSMSPRKLMRLNDLKLLKDELIPGKIYYIAQKKNRAKQETHVLQPGETLWDVAHAYGIKMSKLRKKNRLKKRDIPKVGRVLLLRKQLGKKEKPTYQFPVNPTRSIELVESSTFEEELKEKKPILKEIPIPKRTQVERTPVVQHTPKKVTKVTQQEIPEQAKVHYLKQNETIITVSHRFQVSLKQLKAWNPRKSYSDIPAGTPIIIGFQDEQQLRRYTGSPQREINGTSSSISTLSNKYHVVQKGDTLYSISRRYKVPIADIQQKNKKSNNSLSIGEKLLIK